MAKEHAYNTIAAENMELESGYIAENSYTSANQHSDESLGQVKMEFDIGDENESDGLTEQTVCHIEEEGGDLRHGSDIPDGMIEKTSLIEETANIFEVPEEDYRHLRLHNDILEGLIAETSVPEQSTDPLSRDIRTNCDILECMTVTSSPAEQTIDLLDEVSAALGRNDMYSPDENNSEHVYVTGAPTLVIIGANHKFTVGSRYRSAPSASYHDLCKAGHKHYLEDPKRRILGTIKGARPLMRTTGDAISVSKAETRKKAFLRRSSLPSPVIGKGPQTHIENMDLCKMDFNCLKLRCNQGEIKPPWAPNSGHSSSRSKTDVHTGKKTVVPSPKLLENSSRPVKGIKTRREAGSHSRSTKEKTREPLNNLVSSKTPPTQKKSSSMKTRIYKNLPSFSHSKNQSNSKEATIKKSVDVLEKTLYLIERSTDKKPAKRVLKVPSSSQSLQHTDEAKEPMGDPSSPSTPVTPKRPSSIKARLHKDLKSCSPSKHQSKPEQAKSTGTVDVPEKTLYMIEPISDQKPLRRASILASSNKSPKSDKKTPKRASISSSFSKQLPNSRRTSHISENEVLKDNKKATEFDNLSPSSTSESILAVSIGEEPNEPLGENQQDSDSMNIQRISTTTADGPSGPSTETAKSNCNRESEITETCDMDEKDGSSWMAKFSRGTTNALQCADNSSENLPFSTGRHLDDDENAQDEIVCLKKTGETDDKPRDTKPETEKIFLRHQEAVGKNYNLDLNNVIEETASILVKTRKSKVKALVGAFETVISLRDRKPVVQSRVS